MSSINGFLTNVLYQAASGLMSGTLIAYLFETAIPTPKGNLEESGETLGQLALNGVAAVMNADFSARWFPGNTYPTQIVFYLALMGGQLRLTHKLNKLSTYVTKKLVAMGNQLDGYDVADTDAPSKQAMKLTTENADNPAPSDEI